MLNAQAGRITLQRGADLLSMACGKLARTRAVACIKDSELRYVAVSPAFAALHAMEPGDFAGLTDAQLPFEAPNEIRDELERRAIVFGCDSEFDIHSNATRLSQRLKIEQFVSETGDIFLYEHGEAPVAQQPREVPVLEALLHSQEAEEEEPEADEDVADADTGFLKLLVDALSHIDAGIVILDTAGRVAFCNAKMVQLYMSYMGTVRRGEHLGDVLARGIERGLDPNVDPSDRDACARWVETRLEAYRAPYFEDILQTRAGRWIRAIHRRLPNGYMVGLALDITDGKEREALLARQKGEVSLYKAILDALPVPVFVRDENHVLTYVNEVQLGLVPQGGSMALGLSEADIFGDDADAYFEENDRVLRTGVVTERETKMKNCEGGQTPLLCRVSRADLPDGKRYVVGSLTDISALKQRELEIEKARGSAEAARRQLLDIMNSIDTGIMVIRQDDLTIEIASENVLAKWKDTPLEGLVGRSFLEMMDHNEITARFGAAGKQMLDQAKKRWSDEIRSGTVALREVESSDGEIYVVQGRQIDGGMLVLTYNDITELRRQDRVIDEARAKLEETGRLMNEALVAMAQGLILMSGGRIIIFNDAVSRLLELPDGMMRDQVDWAELFDYCAGRGDFGADPAAFLDDISSRIRAGEIIDLNFCVNKNRWIRMEAKPTGTRGIVVLLTDVTELRRRQDELQRLLARAEKADRAKSDFLAGVSHEIRTPMNGVLSMAELLSRSPLDTRQKTYADAIGKSAKSLMTIINDILEFSKLESGTMELKAVNFDPIEAVDDVVALFAAKAEDKGVTLLVTGDAGLPRRVRGDALRFRQIVFNLVNNAVKYTDHGHVEIRLRPGADVNGLPTLDIEVEDTGRGIAADRLERIFEKFTSGGAAAGRHSEGLGLGLAMTDGLVGLFGGTINVESEIGKGTVFHLILPFECAERRNGGDMALPIAGASILVVDAVDISRDSLITTLKGWAADATGVDNIDDALEILEAACEAGLSVDALVVSSTLPRRGAATLVRALKANAHFARVPVILLTSALPEALQGAADIAADAQLQLPVRASLLMGALCDILAVRRNAQSLRSVLEIERRVSKRAEIGPQERLCVLVAEDNEVNVLVYQHIFEAIGCSYQVACDGKQAVEMWQRLKPAIVLMDVAMPVMDGYAATAAIRAEEAREGLPRTPIIGVTAHLFDNDRNACLEAGMDDYLAKPISQDHLTAMIETWRATTAAGQQGRSPDVNRSA